MYTEYFGFQDEPFRLTPDPDFFYCSLMHEEVISLITYGVENKKGFMVLTGEVGTGKTTLGRLLLRKFNHINTCLMLNPFLEPGEMLYTICRDFGIEIEGNENKGKIYEILSDFFVKEYKKGKNSFIIVDESQNLSFEAFETIRQISNLEMENAKLVQILFMGQPELSELLNSDRLRQLRQRISVFAELVPLPKEETANYVNFRVQEALEYKKYLFSDSALKLIHKFSKGVPREINQLADMALLITSGEKNKRVTVSEVKKAAKEYYRMKKLSGGKKKKLAHKVFSALIIILIFFIGYQLLNINNINLIEVASNTYNNLIQAQKTENVQPTPSQPEKKESTPEHTRPEPEIEKPTPKEPTETEAPIAEEKEAPAEIPKDTEKPKAKEFNEENIDEDKEGKFTKEQVKVFKGLIKSKGDPIELEGFDTVRVFVIDNYLLLSIDSRLSDSLFEALKPAVIERYTDTDKNLFVLDKNMVSIR